MLRLHFASLVLLHLTAICPPERRLMWFHTMHGLRAPDEVAPREGGSGRRLRTSQARRSSAPKPKPKAPTNQQRSAQYALCSILPCPHPHPEPILCYCFPHRAIRQWNHQTVREDALKTELLDGNSVLHTLGPEQFWSVESTTVVTERGSEWLDEEILVFGVDAERRAARWRVRLPVLAAFRRQVRESRMSLPVPPSYQLASLTSHTLCFLS
jgi:hypothetical protein